MLWRERIPKLLFFYIQALLLVQFVEEFSVNFHQRQFFEASNHLRRALQLDCVDNFVEECLIRTVSLDLHLLQVVSPARIEVIWASDCSHLLKPRLLVWNTEVLANDTAVIIIWGFRLLRRLWLLGTMWRFFDVSFVLGEGFKACI